MQKISKTAFFGNIATNVNVSFLQSDEIPVLQTAKTKILSNELNLSC
ncbi:hypothetical protein swp_3740 [Shewanella piezotolerans WP3]|uniref:Uncharacterized protein n=1 Tax=Shewanella piezotolerans (strain WP3 / JCM 13877) TaxID=225849 RepID=B8CSD2_SHEPW|nr:hypothetical protein swp_3740 [Shewanella piezotolerans WP3]